MDDELDLGRYASALRRRTRLIVVAGLLGACLGLVWGLLAPMTMSGSLQAIDRSAELDAAGVDPDNVDVRPIISRIASRINSDGFESRLDNDDATISARAVLTEDDGVIAVVITGRSVDDVEDAEALAVAESSRMYADEMSDLVGGISASFERTALSAETRLAAVEQQLAAAGPGQTTLTEGLLLQAEELRTTQAESLDQVAALDRLVTNLQGDFVLVGETTPGRARSPWLLAVAGALAALAVVCAVVVLRTAFDRRIRSRRDLAHIGLVNLVGVVSTDTEDNELDVLAGVLRQVARRADADVIQLVPVSEAGGDSLADRLGARLDGCVVHARPPLDSDASATMVSAGQALNVVTVAWGRDDRDDVALSSNRLAAASDVPVAIVLLGVPKRELEGVER